MEELIFHKNPSKVYGHFKEDRTQLLKDHRGKKKISGIYYLINLTNGHCYVGSSKNLAGRRHNYLNTSLLMSKKKC